MDVLAIIAAGGTGERAGASLPKQYVEINGKPILAHTIDKFEESVYVKQIVLVAPAGFLDETKLIVGQYAYSKVAAVVAGGETRQCSVYNGLKHANGFSCGKVLVHDAARPFVTQTDIRNVVEAIGETGCAILAAPVTDSIIQLDECGNTATQNRDTLYAVQTPQGFDFQFLVEAHRAAAASGFNGHDDSALTERMGIRTKLVRGGYHNLKLTTAQDMLLAELLLK